MDWNIVWGFKGEGTYVIFNKATPVCLEVNSHNQILIASYEPFNEAQLWDIRSYGGKDVYTIQNVRHLTFLEVFQLRLCAYGNALEIASEETDERVKDKQRWFLQKVA
ncbi:MAG: hypothetical protein Q9194_005251 [Teloschistes cf. exilis]